MSMTVKSEVSPFASIVLTSELSAEESPPLPTSAAKDNPPSLMELVLEFWRAVNCGNLVATYDVAEEVSQK